MSALLPIIVAALLSSSANYDCTLDTPRAIEGAPGQERSSAIEIPNLGPLRFQIELREQGDDALDVNLRWPRDPFNVAGRTAALPTGEGAVAFVAMSRGPCLFTEGACMTLVNLVDETPQRARISLMPSGLVQEESGMRRPLNVLLSGTCARSESNR